MCVPVYVHIYICIYIYIYSYSYCYSYSYKIYKYNLQKPDPGSKITPLYIAGSFKEPHQPNNTTGDKILVDLQVPILNILLLQL